MKLWLMRHGDAIDMAEDAVRPLSQEGRTEALNAGAFLKKVNSSPDLILHSTLRRAAETASIIAAELNISNRLSERQGLEPDDDPEVWAAELAIEDGDTLVAGHLPFVPRLASLLLTGKKDGLAIRWTTGSIMCLSRESCNDWKLLYFITSKGLSKGLSPLTR